MCHLPCRTNKALMNPNEGNTRHFLEQWNKGDRSGLDGLLKRHLPWIHNHVRNRLGPYLRGKAETCDYVQDALVEFLQYGPKIEISDERHFRALLAKIVENMLRGKWDWYKAKRRRISRLRPLPSDSILSLDPPKEGVSRPSQMARAHEREALIRLGMDLLDPEDSEIIVLHQWEGMTFADIGKQLQITPDAARMRHARAVSRLAEKVSLLRKGNLARALEENPPS